MLTTFTKSMVCHCCGQLKPESAFQFDIMSKNYSTICKQCHSQNNNTPANNGSDAADGDHNREELRYQLDNKARLKISQDRIQHFKDHQALEKQLQHKRDQQFIEANFKKVLLSKTDKAKRELLAAKTKTAKKSSPKAAQQAQQPRSASTTTQQAQSQEPKPVSTLAFHFLDAPTGGMVARSYGALFGRFRDYLGKGAPINTILSQYSKQLTPTVTLKNPVTAPPDKPKESLVSKFINSLSKKR